MRATKLTLRIAASSILVLVLLTVASGHRSAAASVTSSNGTSLGSSSGTSLGSSSVAAAERDGKVTCIVKDREGMLPGAVIRIKGSETAAVTDLDGKATLELGSSAAAKADGSGEVTLVVSLMGYKSVELRAAAGSTVEVTLEEDSQYLDEIVVIGYGTAKRKDYTGSVSSVRLEDSPIALAVNSNALESIKGNVAGLDIGATNSAGGQPSMQIRGQKSISGSSAPLIVLDGLIFMGGINDINPADIASIDVLKDASSAAAYGSRSANGVIVITTRKGASGKPIISFNASCAIATWSNKPKMKQGQDYVDAIMAGLGLQDLSWMSRQEYYNYQNGNSTDWLAYSTRTGIKQDYQAAVSGAGEKVNYYLSASWTDNRGIVKGDDFNRLNLMAKISTDITSWLKINADVSYTRQDYSGIEANMLTAYYLSPYGMPYRADSDKLEKYPMTQSDGLQNPLWQTDTELRQQTDIRDNYRLQTSALIRCPWVEGLSARLNFSYTDTRRKSTDFRHSGYFVKEGNYDDDTRYSMATLKNLLASAEGTVKNEKTKSLLFDAIINYNRTFGKHSIDATLVATRDRSTYDAESFNGKGFLENGNTTLGINGLGKAENYNIWQDGAETANIGYLARAMYSYDERYSFTASYRRDGASVFGRNKRWGNFWSLGAAWTPSKEAFWGKNLRNILTDFKVKASYGVNGNQTLAAFSTLSKVTNGKNGGIMIEFDNSEISYGVAIQSMGNNDLGWEATTAFNTGFESSFFKGRLDLDVDFYYSQTKDQIFTRTIPVMTGFESVKSTMGQVDNLGFEMTIRSININRSGFQWTSGLTFWINRNKLVHLYGEDLDGDGKEDDDISNNLFIGKSLGAVYGYIQDGIVQTDDYDYIGLYKGVPGSPKYVDLNEDGVIDSEDRAILGYSSPNFKLNFANTLSYKQFELYFMLSGTFGGGGRFIRSNPNAFRLTNVTGYSTANRIDIPWWTPENRSDTYPSPTFSTDGRYLALQDRTFVRLQDLTLSYSLKKSLLERAKMSSLKVFISGKNLFTITNWVGDDPETGSSVLSSALPVSRSVTAGVSISF